MSTEQMVALARALKSLEGQEAWQVSGSVSTGSSFQLQFGTRIARDPVEWHGRQIVTQHGESTLFVMCPWRVEENDMAIAASGDEIEEVEAPSEQSGLEAVLSPLLGRKIIRTSLQPSCDLTVDFEHGVRLLVFCDISPRTREQSGMCYSVSTPVERVVVLTSGEMRVSSPEQERHADQ